MAPPGDLLDRLQRLRALFLDGARGDAALRDYWRDPADLAAYDAVLAARIGWKWDAALAEALARGFARDPGRVVLDYGCGTGIAARRFAAHCGAAQVLCHDRSGAAMAFAAAAVAREHPGVRAAAAPRPAEAEFDVLLVSHVLGELDAQGLAELRPLLGRAKAAVLVEPGDRRTARRLAALRDELRAAFRIVAPCPHAQACPTLAGDADWCHFFAAPPAEVFTDGEWVRTARALGIDLRALPYAFLCLDRTGAPLPAPPPQRALGRAAVGPHAAEVQACTAAGLVTHQLAKRTAPAVWRALKKHPEAVRDLPLPPG